MNVTTYVKQVHQKYFIIFIHILTYFFFPLKDSSESKNLRETLFFSAIQ